MYNFVHDHFALIALIYYCQQTKSCNDFCLPEAQWKWSEVLSRKCWFLYIYQWILLHRIRILNSGLSLLRAGSIAWLVITRPRGFCLQTGNSKLDLLFFFNDLVQKGLRYTKQTRLRHWLQTFHCRISFERNLYK